MNETEEEEFEFRYRLEQEESQSASYQEQPQSAMSGSFPEARAILSSDAPLAQKAWQMAQVPSQMASRGLKPIANLIPEPEPIGNVPVDLLRDIPHVAANTLAEAAPGFISRAALLTGMASQALRPVGKALAPVGKWAAGIAEDWSGVKPGTLVDAAKDATLIFSKGQKSAKPLYEAGKAELEQGTNIFKNMYKPDEIIKTAQDYLSKGGKLEPAEALMYRKALDIVGRSRGVVKDSLVEMRDVADKAVKASSNMSAADALYQRGIQAQSMRKLFPTNVSGRASPMKVAEAGWIAHVLDAPGKILAAWTSPLVQGATATLGGAAARIAANYESAIFMQQAYSHIVDKFTTKQGTTRQ